jgi:CheY-specific phosphatase CheX
MSIRFFGQFLLEKNSLTVDQLIQATKYQESINLKFGEYAHTMSYISDSDIQRLQDEQKKTDMMIGELAVKLGMLNDEQVKEILTAQKNDHIFLGEVLSQLGFMSKETVDKELALFKEDQAGYVPGEIAIPEGVKNPDNLSDLVDITEKILRRVVHLDVKVTKGLFIKDAANNSIRFPAVSVKLSGGVNYEYVLSVPQDAAIAIASNVMGEDASYEPDDILLDGVKEFCNIVCGNFSARMAQKGKTIELSPPVNTVLSGDKDAVSFSLASTAGEMKLILVED